MAEQGLVPVDALRALAVPLPSPTLTVMQEITEDGKKFTLKHEPIPCPPLPPAPEKVRSGRRAHRIATLTDLKKYVDEVNPANEAGDRQTKPIAFYTPKLVSLVLSEADDKEKEVVLCDLERHPQFERWNSMMGDETDQRTLLEFLRLNTAAMEDHKEGSSSQIIGEYSGLTGTLVHDAEDYLDQQARMQKFHVKRKKKGGSNQEEEAEAEVSTEFQIAIKILADDAAPTIFNVLVRMDGAPGAQIVFTLNFENGQELIEQHINDRLDGFAEDAGFLCVRGEFKETPWTQPEIPRSITQLLELQTKMIAACAASSRA